jgi:hypothetical protein
MRATTKSKAPLYGRRRVVAAVRRKIRETPRPHKAQPSIHKCHRWHNWLLEEYPF